MTDVFGLVGTVVAGKYRVERVIGEGGFGIVYAGTQTMLGQRVAIKCLKLPGDAASQRAASESFLREARVLFELGHPAIVRMYDAGELPTPLGPVLYVVLELVDGLSLDAEIARRAEGRAPPFTANEITDLMGSVLDGLGFAHARGVSHRDLKPANVIVVRAPDGKMSGKIVDFGTARVSSASPGHTGPASGVTPRYAAPEQWDASFGTTGPATDIFAAGLVLEEMCTLSYAIAGDSLPAIMSEAMSTTRASRVASVRPELAPLAAVASRATAVRPEARFASAAELRAAMLASLGQTPGASPSYGPPLPRPAHVIPSLAPGGSAVPPGQSPYAATAAPPMRSARPAPVASGSSGAAVLLIVLALGGGLLAILALAGVAGWYVLRQSEDARAPIASAAPVSTSPPVVALPTAPPDPGGDGVPPARPTAVPTRTSPGPRPPVAPRPTAPPTAPTAPAPAARRLVFRGGAGQSAGLAPHQAKFAAVANRSAPGLESCFRQMGFADSWTIVARFQARKSAGTRRGLGKTVVSHEGKPDTSLMSLRLRDCTDNQIAMWPWPSEEIEGIGGGPGYILVHAGLVWTK